MNEQVPNIDPQINIPETSGRIEVSSKAEDMAHASKEVRDRIFSREAIIADLRQHIEVSDDKDAEKKITDMAFENEMDSDRADDLEDWAAFIYDSPNADPTLTAEEALNTYNQIQWLAHYTTEPGSLLDAIDAIDKPEFMLQGDERERAMAKVEDAVHDAHERGIYDDDTYEKVLASLYEAQEREDRQLMRMRYDITPFHIQKEGINKANAMKDRLLTRLGFDDAEAA